MLPPGSIVLGASSFFERFGGGFDARGEALAFLNCKSKRQGQSNSKNGKSNRRSFDFGTHVEAVGAFAEEDNLFVGFGGATAMARATTGERLGCLVLILRVELVGAGDGGGGVAGPA